jgi:hypothetical protein
MLFFVYGSMQLNELIPQISLVFHKKDVLISTKTGLSEQKPGFWGNSEHRLCSSARDGAMVNDEQDME